MGILRMPNKAKPKATVTEALMERLGQVGAMGDVASSIKAVADTVRGEGTQTWAKVLGGLALTVICTPPQLLPLKLQADAVKALATAVFAASQVFGKKVAVKSFDFIETASEVVARAQKIKRALEPVPEEGEAE